MWIFEDCCSLSKPAIRAEAEEKCWSHSYWFRAEAEKQRDAEAEEQRRAEAEEQPDAEAEEQRDAEAEKQRKEPANKSGEQPEDDAINKSGGDPINKDPGDGGRGFQDLSQRWDFVLDVGVNVMTMTALAA